MFLKKERTVSGEWVKAIKSKLFFINVFLRNRNFPSLSLGMSGKKQILNFEKQVNLLISQLASFRTFVKRLLSHRLHSFNEERRKPYDYILIHYPSGALFLLYM